MKNISSLMKQAAQMQQKMQEMQDKLEALQVTGESGAGLIRVTLNGKGEMCSLFIDPKLADPTETEMLQDLVIAAYRDAKSKLDATTAEEMQKATSGLQLPPGVKLPF